MKWMGAIAAFGLGCALWSAGPAQALTVRAPSTTLSAECRTFDSGRFAPTHVTSEGAATLDCNERRAFGSAEQQITGKAETGLGRAPKAIAQAEYTSNNGSAGVYLAAGLTYEMGITLLDLVPAIGRRDIPVTISWQLETEGSGIFGQALVQVRGVVDGRTGRAFINESINAFKAGARLDDGSYGAYDERAAEITDLRVSRTDLDRGFAFQVRLEARCGEIQGRPTQAEPLGECFAFADPQFAFNQAQFDADQAAAGLPSFDLSSAFAFQPSAGVLVGPAPVPLPSGLPLLGLALAGLWGLRQRRQALNDRPS